MKKTAINLAAFTLALLVLNGCSNMFLEKPQDRSSGGTVTGSPGEIPEGFGTVAVSLTQGAARTIMPEIELSSLYLEYFFTKDGGAAEEKTPVDGKFVLEPGVYGLEVRAFADGAKQDLVAQGTTDTNFTVNAGINAGTVNLSLHPIASGTGAGELEYRLEYPAGVTVETLTLSRIAGAESPIDLTVGGTGSSTNLSGTKTNVPVGYYLLRAVLKNGGGDSTGRTEVVHIYQNLRARVEYVFIADDFRAYRVSSAADTGPGSLRQVLIDVLSITGGPQTIQVVLEPGTVIELGSALPEITKSLTIEGNGVTLTRAASWTTISATSQLLRISGSTTEVVIRRLHFKDGLADYFGAAIYNFGILTLESCVFSGNRTTRNDANGSAICSGNTLTIRGCTFYGNTAGYYGGAVYFSASGKTLTLTGNLFYGNTAASGYPVVYWYYGTINASYNVANAVFGTDDNQTGWYAGTGDTTTSAPLVSPLSFKLLYGSEAETRLPVVLPADYPVTDFYGNPISGGGAAGAVQESTAQGGYYLELLVNNSLRGSVTVNSTPDADGLYPVGSIITANPNNGYSLAYWLVNGIKTGTAPLSLSAHSRVQAVFGRPVTITIFTDGAGSATTQGTLRYALTNAQDGDIITFSGVTAGSTVIELGSALPEITKSMTIEGNGVTLTRAASWTADMSQLLYISGSTAEILIKRLHFKDGLATDHGGAISNDGILTLESCIFSGNRTTRTADTDVHGGAIWSDNTLTVRGCTFYGNTADSGGAVYFLASGETLTLTGNLFSGNTALAYPVVYKYYTSSTVIASYNVVDAAFGTGYTQAGWAAGIGDMTTSALPVSGKTFRLLFESEAGAKLPVALPVDYPLTDFYGDPISGGGAAGAVQASTVQGGGYYYLELSVNNSLGGSVTVNSIPDADGLCPAGSIITASPNSGYSLAYWLVNGIKTGTAPLSLSTHSRIQAVFSLLVTVFSDGAGSETVMGTLRYALTNAEDGDIITFSGVTAGTTVIELGSSLPAITKSLTIEGNGITLTRAASWTASDDESQLLRIIAGTAGVLIRRVHFKDGLVTGSGGAILNGGNLTLESCIFSGNQATGNSGDGGAILSFPYILTIRGCTFYGNTAGNLGGAVVFWSSGWPLTLTGNLFYGNTVPDYPVVYNNGGNVNASYNVVDAAFGTGIAQAGWNAGTGDTTITAPPVSGKTFKLLYGSEAGAKLPATLPDGYPVTDFYGNPVSGGGAAGAVQGSTAQGYYYLDLSVNNSLGGSVTVNSIPDADGLYPAGSIITASPNSGYSLAYWLVNGIKTGTAPLSLYAHSRVQAVFNRTVTVTVFTDGTGSTTTPGTLRYALTNAQNGDIIIFSGVTAGATVIELESALPEITKSLVIEGNGVTLTRAASWTASDYYSQLLRIGTGTMEVLVRRVHFKDGLVTDNGGAIYNEGNLTLESCIFSGNRTTDIYAYGGAIRSNNTLTVRGCTFYGNTAGSGGAVYFYAYGRTLTLTGNLFYENTAFGWPVILASGTVNASYNMADVAFGTGSAQAGWAAGTGDTTITVLPVLPPSFKLLYGSEAGGKLPGTLPVDYPLTDFYGDPISGGGAAGAVQGSTVQGYYYLELSVNNSLRGSVTVNSTPDADGLYLAGSVITANPNSGYSLTYWLVNGVKSGTAPLILSAHSQVQAVFNRVVTVNDFTDEAGSATTPGTLRYALTNAQDGDIINLSGVTAGTTVIELKSTLPEITKSLTIEGNGVTLTRAASWTAGDYYSQLLRVYDSTAEVLIRRLHFKNGLTTLRGGAINNIGILTLESCIFNSNQATGNSGDGGAISSNNILTVRGCTFYGNTADIGGAVLFSVWEGETLTLTGNLFYGNTAPYNPVMAINGTVNASYNVVDVAFGTEGRYEAGWDAGTGDTTIAAMPVSGKSFRLFYGSEAGAKLPAVLPVDYPLADFYGNPISGGGAAGAVQGSTERGSGYYYLDLSVNNSLRGSVTVSPLPDADGLYQAGSAIGFTASPNGGYSFGYWLVNGVMTGTAPLSLSAHTRVQAVFGRPVTVNVFSDGAGSETIPGTLRYALTNAQDGDIITVNGVTAGTTVVELGSALPEITKSLVIKGNGVTLTRAASWTTSDYDSQLLRITSPVEVLVHRVHFKNGLTTYYAGAIYNYGILTLESCIFSGNRASFGGTLHSSNALTTIRGCTFYGNTADSRGGAVYLSSGTLTLTGNLFYENTAASSYPVVYNYNNNGTISASYNVADAAFGTGTTQAGWAAGTGDKTTLADSDGLTITGDPFNTTTFVPVSALQSVLPATAPTDFPTTDFYGATRTFPGAPGAVK
jgi:hypothetical protein